MRIPLVVKRSVAGVAVVGVGLVVLIGYAHTRGGRQWLAFIKPLNGHRGGGCPFGFDRVATPEQKQAARSRFAQSHRGSASALNRPALGFTLDRTTRSDVLAWASAHAIHCVKPVSGVDLDCANVPASLLPAPFQGAPLRDLWLNFGAHDELVSVAAIRREPSAETISSAFSRVAAALHDEAGAPSSTAGDGSAASLSEGLLHQASIEYRFRDYYALARATNMGDGYVLTEQYRSLAN